MDNHVRKTGTTGDEIQHTLLHCKEQSTMSPTIMGVFQLPEGNENGQSFLCLHAENIVEEQ